MDRIRIIAIAYTGLLTFAGMTNYLPGLTDSKGLAFGIFALDIYDDMLHFGSALWAGLAAWTSRRASELFFRTFGTLYLADGLLGLITGSGYLDMGILIYGVQDLPLTFKIFANLPHIFLGGFAAFTGFFLAKRIA
jgi:hypothetical protein